VAIPRAYRDLVAFFPLGDIKALSRSPAVVGFHIAIPILPQQLTGITATDPFAVGWPIVIRIVGVWPVEEWIIIVPVPAKINHRSLVVLAVEFVKVTVGVPEMWLFRAITLVKLFILLQIGRTERWTLSLRDRN